MDSRFHGNDQKEFGALDYITDNEGVFKEHYQLVASDEGINLNIHRIKKGNLHGLSQTMRNHLGHR